MKKLYHLNVFVVIFTLNSTKLLLAKSHMSVPHQSACRRLDVDEELSYSIDFGVYIFCGNRVKYYCIQF